MERKYSLILKQSIISYRSITALRVLLPRLDAGPNPGTHLQATVLVDLCHNVSRDLAYLEQLMYDVTAALKEAASYHTEWAREVRAAAAQSLSKANAFIATKIPGTAQPSFQFQDLITSASKIKVLEAMNDPTSMTALQQQLVAAHAGLVGATGLMHRLALQQDSMAKDEAEDRSIETTYSEGAITASSCAGS